MTGFEVNGERLLPDVSGALYWPAEATLIVADVHLEKGSAFAARGQFLPPYDSVASLERLAEAAQRLRPKRVIALGDSFHDGKAASRMAPKTAGFLSELTAAFQWIWIVGNHDPEPPAGFGGEIFPELKAGPFLFRHEPHAGHVLGEVAGHLHPCASVVVKGRRMRRRCFATDGHRVVLPAFGAFTGGLDVLDVAFANVLRPDFHAWMIGRDQVYPIASRRLVSEAA
jgi:uncharacterized protein